MKKLTFTGKLNFFTDDPYCHPHIKIDGKDLIDEMGVFAEVATPMKRNRYYFKDGDTAKTYKITIEEINDS